MVTRGRARPAAPRGSPNSLVGVQQVARQVDARQQAGVGDPHRLARRGDRVLGAGQGRVAGGEVLGLLDRARQVGHRARLLQHAGVAADHLAVDGDGGGEVRLGGLDVGARLREAGLGLGDVGAGDLADPEAVAGGLELAAQALLVVERQLEHGAVLPGGGVGVDRVQQHVLLGRQQVRPLGEDLALGPPHAGGGAAAGVEVLAQRQVDLAGGRVGVLRAVLAAVAGGADARDEAGIGWRCWS